MVDKFSLSEVRNPSWIIPVTPAGIPAAFHVTVSTSPTVHTELEVGLVIGGAKTVRVSNGAARIKEKKKKRHRVIRGDIIWHLS